MSQVGIPFKFKRNARIGEAAAEQDDEFLFQSFYDIGDYSELVNTRSPRRIVVGRTGSGKTALLRYLMHSQEHVVEIDPEHLALSFIANNDVIRFFEGLGVKLDLFYSLLWKHVLAVELLKRKYQLTTEEKTRSWIDSFLESFNRRDQAKERALKYLKEWGDKFWIETEYRIKELTTKLATELSAQIGAEGIGMLQGKGALSEEQKRDIIHRGQAVVNAVQIKELAEVVNFLHEDVFTDDQRPYFITIDKLDENWVDDSLRYKLIRALIETTRSFQRVQNVKVVIALRQDLLRKVFSETADGGFQEEKYEALMLRLRWSKKQIEELLDRRVAVLVSAPHTSRLINFKQLFPEKIGKGQFLDYFVQRTALRPRDAILFVNDCLARSEAVGQVKVQAVFEAEREYSRLRKDSLIYEWSRIYPSLAVSCRLLERSPAEFRLSSLDKEQTDRVIQELAEAPNPHDSCQEAAVTYMNAVSGSKNAVVAELFRVFFDVGLVGLRLEGSAGMTWSQDSTPPTSGQIKPNTKAQVHPMFYQALSTHFDT
jgi:hypothetical protein